MKRGFVVAVGGMALLIAGLSGCSSEEKKSETEPGHVGEATSETGTASSGAGETKVTIDGQDQRSRAPSSAPPWAAT